MKGPVVAALLYPGVGDRTYGDLDLLVDRRDFPKAMQILEDLGYAHDIHNWALAEEMLAGQVGLATPTMHVDLHWHLHYSEQDRRPFAFPIEAMIERGRRVPVSGVDTPTLDPVDTLLTLAFHAARSDGHRLMWFKDVERSRRRRRARTSTSSCGGPGRYHCGGPVGLILNRARYLLDAPIPLDVVLGADAARRCASSTTSPRASRTRCSSTSARPSPAGSPARCGRRSPAASSAVPAAGGPLAAPAPVPAAGQRERRLRTRRPLPRRRGRLGAHVTGARVRRVAAHDQAGGLARLGRPGGASSSRSSAPASSRRSPSPASSSSAARCSTCSPTTSNVERRRPGAGPRPARGPADGRGAEPGGRHRAAAPTRRGGLPADDGRDPRRRHRGRSRGLRELRLPRSPAAGPPRRRRPVGGGRVRARDDRVDASW